jgi:hypothetical protein
LRASVRWINKTQHPVSAGCRIPRNAASAAIQNEKEIIMNRPNKKPTDEGHFLHDKSRDRTRTPSLAAEAADVVAGVLCRTLMQMRNQLRLTAHEESDLPARVVAEFQRDMPGVVLKMTIVALLPDIRNRLYLKFLKYPMPHSDADDLAQNVVSKVLDALNNKACPHSNIGAWLARIALSVVSDHFRRRRRRKEVSDAALASISDGYSHVDEFHAWEDRGYSAHDMYNGIPKSS